MQNNVIHKPNRDATFTMRLPTATLDWLKVKAAADCRSVSSFVLKLIREQQRFDRDDELAAAVTRELVAV